MQVLADGGTASFRRSSNKRVAPQDLGITAHRRIWLLEAFQVPHVLPLPVSQQLRLCDRLRPLSLPPTLTWTLCSRIINSHCPGKASRTAGLQVDRVRWALVSYWIGQLLETGLPESDPKEGAKVLLSMGTDRETQAPFHLTRDPPHDHPPPPTPRQVIPHARIPSLSRNFLIAQRLRTALEFLWTRKGMWLSTLWLRSISLNITRPPLSRHSSTTPPLKINRALDSRGGLARVIVMAA